jgi:hypothetical protein
VPPRRYDHRNEPELVSDTRAFYKASKASKRNGKSLRGETQAQREDRWMRDGGPDEDDLVDQHDFNEFTDRLSREADEDEKADRSDKRRAAARRAVDPGVRAQLGDTSWRRQLGPVTLSGDASGAILGALALVLFVQYLHGGPSQVKAWLAAKMLNRVAGDPGNALGSGKGNDFGLLSVPGMSGVPVVPGTTTRTVRPGTTTKGVQTSTPAWLNTLTPSAKQLQEAR